MPRFIIIPSLCITCFLLSANGQGLRVRDPYIHGYHPLDAEPYIASPLNAPNAVILELHTTMFKDTAQIDFEKRQVTFRRYDPLGYTMWEFHYPELTDYLASRNIYSFGRTWKKELALLKKESAVKQRQSLKLEWELPVQYPTWAQRVLGKEPPKLSIDGFLEITIGYANTQFDEDIPAERGKDNDDFTFDINYSFGITGSVGRLINLNIRADKEQNFDISNNLKNFKVEYKEITPGELEDEVIQEVIIGYTGFSMPGTNLSGYSESHEGLFGIKVKAQLGPLELTTIASTEQGQSNKKSYSSGSSTNKAVFKAKDFSRDRYFFLDTLYRRYYIKKYAIRNSDPNTPPPPQVKSLSVWRSFDRSFTEKKSHIKEVRVDSSLDVHLYERLERDRHYFLDDIEGYIRFADSVTILDKQSVAIFLRTEDPTANPSLQKGSFEVTVTDTSIDTVWNLWTLRPLVPIDSVGADPARFNLMWRNVYGPADFGDQESFELAINLVDNDKEERVQTLKDGTFFTDLFGLAEKNVPLFQNTQIFNTQFNDLILPPFDTGAAALEPFNNSGLEIRDSLIYRYGRNNQKLSETGTDAYRSVYEIEMSGSKKQTTFDDLGWGIMEGTEVVKADGIRLERDRDYTINYDMGVIDLTSARAKAAEKIDIDYQSEALFIPERKMFLGTHGKLNLPFISDKSYAGTSLLFQSTESNDDIPRLDQEPYSKMLFDINTHVEFEPEWMTKLANALPLVETEATSSVTMDVEFANSRVNPNKRDKAYVDDFEDSKQSDPFSNSDDLWFKASPPVEGDSLYYYPPAWDFYWFTPTLRDQVHKVRRDEIIELTDEERKNAVGPDDLGVLRLHATPSPPADSLEGRFKKSWAGIMHPVSQSFANKEQMQYFEFFVKADDPLYGFKRKGKLKLQMGVMREDISLDGKPPNGKADREDTAQIIQTQTYDENLDLGWDKLKDKDEKYFYPAATEGKWDSVGYGNPLLGIDSLDPARDNYREYRNDEDSDPANYRWACGEQGDASIQYSEDINFDGVVQTAVAEQYFQFTIDLADGSSPFIDRTVNYAEKDTSKQLWRKYRIPLHEVIPGYEAVYDTINNPTWANITMLRVIWTDFDSLRLQRESKLIFWNMEFVGNQWMEVADDSSRIKIRSSVVNTKEDLIYEEKWERYQNLITRERDELGWELEQSLRLNYVNLVPGDTALVEKSFQYQTLNLSAYENLSLLVYGWYPDGTDPPVREPLHNGDIRFVFRFGTDDSTYYEYSRPIYPEWRNEIMIDLKQLSDIKDAYMVGHRDSVIYLETPLRGTDDERKVETIRIRAPEGRQPNFSRVKWMAMGVICNGHGAGEDSLSGEIWVNEMKLVGIKNINGWASRADFSTKMADLLSLQARMEYENGDFRRMTENQNLPDNSQVTGSMGASIGLDKLLPEKWGVSIPAGITYNSSVIRPQLKNETDVYLLDEKGRPDDFFDIVTDAATSMVGVQQKNNTLTRSEKYQTNSVGRTYYTSYKKSNKSDNPFVSFLADRWSADARYSTTISELRYGEIPGNNKEFYAKSDTSDIYSGKVQYDLSPYNPPEWMKWSPLKKLKNDWLPSQLKNLEFSLLPRRFSVDVADIGYNEKRLDDTWRDVKTKTYGYTVRHNTSIDYSPISPILDMNYSLSINRDMVNAVYLDQGKQYALRDFELPQKGKKLFRLNRMFNDYYVLWGEKDRTQHAGFNLNPRIFNWFTTSANYTSDYRASVVRYLKDSTDYLNTGVKSGVALNGSLNIDQLLNELKKAAEKKPAKDKPSRSDKQSDPKRNDDPKKNARDTVKTTVLSSLVGLLKKGFETIGLRQISLNYTADSDLKNNYVSPELLEDMGISNPYEMLLYQFGARGRSLGEILSGEMDDHHFLGVYSRDTTSYDRRDFFRNDSRTVGRTYRLSSGLNFKPLELSFRSISLSHSINYNLFNDSTRNDTTVTFPDFSVSFSTSILNKLDFIKKNLTGVSLNSSYSFRETNRITTAQANNSSRTLKMDMMPLISFSGTLKRWPIKFDYRHNYSTDLSMKLSEDATPSDTNKHSISHSDEFTLKYEIDRHSKLSEIKLLTWTIPIKGKTTVGLKFNRSSEVELIQRREDKSFSLMPNLSYIFTDNVTGRVEYTIRQIETEGKTRTTNDFAIVVNIRF